VMGLSDEIERLSLEFAQLKDENIRNLTNIAYINTVNDSLVDAIKELEYRSEECARLTELWRTEALEARVLFDRLWGCGLRFDDEQKYKDSRRHHLLEAEIEE